MINIPVKLLATIDKYISEKRFETRSALVIEALESWIDIEGNDELLEVIMNHEKWDGLSPHPYGCDGGEGEES